ncbi:MAG: gliding motility-associated C-terminal domain-containing protein [Flavobacteriales bacterium]|nr:gliding motility-associated C-terminal domain-containing protein [Flavobacteriales bacterium]
MLNSGAVSRSCHGPLPGVLLLGLATLWAGAAQGQYVPSISFVENKGQWPDAVTYRADAGDRTFWCERGSMVIDLLDAQAIGALHAPDVDHYDPNAGRTIRHHALRFKAIGAAGNARMTGTWPEARYNNYFIGDDPARWASHAACFRGLRMNDVMEGLSLVVHPSDQVFKYDLIIAPGHDVPAFKFTYEGADGLDVKHGSLVIHTSLGDLEERVPLAYQDINGERVPVSCSYRTDGRMFWFRPGPYDKDHPLVIDPTLVFSTFSGSLSDNFGYSATYDNAGFLYSGSTAFGQNYPVTMGAYQTTWAGGDGQGTIQGTDIAITKYDTTGTFIIWATFLGGQGDELPHSLIVDGDDELYVLGSTGSPDYPTTVNGFDQSFGGGPVFTPGGLGVSFPNGSDMIISRLSADGSDLQASTYLGGSDNDGLNYAPALKFNYADEVRGEVLLDDQGRVVIASSTASTDMPITPGNIQGANAGGQDGYIARFDADLTTLQYGSYFGGTGDDAIYSEALNSMGDLVLCGGTTSTDLPVTPGVVGPVNSGGAADAFLLQLPPALNTISICTYWGSSAYDQAYFVEIDGSDSVYILGQTAAPANDLISNAPYNIPTGGQLLTKFNAGLTSVIWSSRVGSGDGTPDISPTAFLVDYCDKIYICGWGSTIGIGAPLSTNGLPITPDAYQSTTDGNDFYLAVFDIDMQGLTYATYMGGPQSHEHVDGGTSRFDRRGRVYESVCAGCGGHDDFPTTPGAWSSTNNSSNCNNAVFKFDFDAPLVVAVIDAPDTVCADAPVPFENHSSPGANYLWDLGDQTTSTAVQPTHAYSTPGTYTVTLTATDPNSCNGQDVATLTLVVGAAGPVLAALNDTLLCGPLDAFTLVANSQGTASDFHWATSPLFTDWLNNGPQDSTATITPAIAGIYYIAANNGSACPAVDSVVVGVSLADPQLTGDSLICADDQAQLLLTGIDPGSSIVWSPSNAILSGQGTTIATVSPSETSAYTVAVTSPAGCPWTSAITVQVSPVNGSEAHATVDQTIVLSGTLVHLAATPTSGVTYSWSPADLVSDPNSGAPTAIVQNTTWFHVTISDGICTKDDSVLVTVHELLCDEPDIFLPNAFSPNGDGSNDVLYVRGRFISAMELQIFDRWGEKVFETTDQSVGWDGTFNGKPVDPAVFVYHLQVTCVDGQSRFFKGNITVIR